VFPILIFPLVTAPRTSSHLTGILSASIADAASDINDDDDDNNNDNNVLDTGHFNKYVFRECSPLLLYLADRYHIVVSNSMVQNPS
jgi:hypothetical protein